MLCSLQAGLSCGTKIVDHYVFLQGEVVAVVRSNPSSSQLTAGSPHTLTQQNSLASTLSGISDKTEKGKEVLTMGPGAYFGEEALSGDRTRPATMVARGKVRLLTCLP